MTAWYPFFIYLRFPSYSFCSWFAVSCTFKRHVRYSQKYWRFQAVWWHRTHRHTGTNLLLLCTHAANTGAISKKTGIFYIPSLDKWVLLEQLAKQNRFSVLIEVCAFILRLKCIGTRAETRFRLLAKRTSPCKLAGTSVQSTTGSQSVRISGSNARYTMFRGSVKSSGYPLHSPVSPSLLHPCVTVCHHILTGLYLPTVARVKV
jgi:hypothetical protein